MASSCTSRKLKTTASAYLFRVVHQLKLCKPLTEIKRFFHAVILVRGDWE